jgi:hypothetical protein
MCLVIKIAVDRSTVVRIKIFDELKPEIIFTSRYKTVTNEEIFYVRLPLTSNALIISIYDDDRGNLPKEQENNIKVIAIEKTPLEKRLDVVDIKNRTIANFVDFAQRFCYNSAYLQAGKSYQSDDGEFLIELVPKIIGKNGTPLATPARISKVSGRIQVSKSEFDTYTVPMKFAILCHEFSHYYLNENMDDESEADINGLLIYLGLGYPRIEGYQAFLEVFKESPSEENKKRFDRIDAFIKNFEKNKMVLQ